MICIIMFRDIREKDLSNYRFFYPNHPLYRRRHFKESKVLDLYESPLDVATIQCVVRIGRRGEKFYQCLKEIVGLQDRVLIGSEAIGIGTVTEECWKTVIAELKRRIRKIYRFDEVYILEDQAPHRQCRPS